MRACGEIQRAALFQGLCSCSRASGSNAGGSGGSSSWNLSLECLQGRNLAECSFGLEIRDSGSNLKLGSSRRRGNSRDLTAPSLTINGTGRFSSHNVERQRQGIKDVHLQLLEKIREFQSLALQGAVQWKYSPLSKALPGTTFLGVVALVVLVGMLKLREYINGRKGVKARILSSQWFKDSRSGNGKRKLDESSSLRVTKSPKTDEADFPVFERLVLHDGEVVRNSDSNRLEPRSRRKISLPSQNDAENVRKIKSEPADTNRPSRIRSFLSRTNDYKGKPLFQNSMARPSTNEQVNESRRQHNWNDKDELDLRQRIEDLRQSVQAAEANRKAAIQALVEERKRSLELEVKIRRQKEAAIALEEEVRVLKESHEALLTSLRKKYSSSVAARAAAALLYQNWESGETSTVIE